MLSDNFKKKKKKEPEHHELLLQCVHVCQVYLRSLPPSLAVWHFPDSCKGRRCARSAISNHGCTNTQVVA